MVYLIGPSHRTPAPLSFPPHAIAIGAIYTAALLSLETTLLPVADDLLSGELSGAVGIVRKFGDKGSWEDDYAADADEIDGECAAYPKVTSTSQRDSVPVNTFANPHRRSSCAHRLVQHDPVHPFHGPRLGIHSLPDVSAGRPDADLPTILFDEYEHGVPPTSLLDALDAHGAQNPPPGAPSR